MPSPSHIAIIGLGNLGWNLSLQLHEQGYNVAQVVARSNAENDETALTIGAERISSLQALDKKIDLIFICTADDEILNVADHLDHNAPLVHCSGSVAEISSKNSGVFYAFQTFTKGIRVAWKDIPIFIESSDEGIAEMLVDIASRLSKNVRRTSQKERLHVHISGVFGANFVNHILYRAKEVLDRSETPLDVIEPLMMEVIRKAFANGPEASQTGPARRGDEKLLQKHMNELHDNEELESIYRLMSEHIQNTYRS